MKRRMFNIEIAGLIVTIDNRYLYTEQQCKDYLTKKQNDTGIALAVTEKQMQDSIDYKQAFDGEKISFPEAEFDAIHYALYGKLNAFGGFWLHSVLIEKDGKGFAFTAVPGTGKTTHAKLWLDAFDDAVIVNGDNTIIRKDVEDGIFYGYGSPFCGKERLNKNCRVPMKAICFLDRSDTNYVEKIKSTDAVMNMFRDNWCIKLQASKEKHYIGDLMRLYVDMAAQVEFYRVHCNTEKEAAFVSYEGISR